MSNKLVKHQEPKEILTGNQKKILFAQSKILDGASIKDVVELCNYDNYSTFYRQYVGFLHHEPAYDKELYANSQK